jgi:TonB family protein
MTNLKLSSLVVFACLLASLAQGAFVSAQETSAEPVVGPMPETATMEATPPGALQGQLDISQPTHPQIEPVGEAPPVINFEPYIQQAHRQIRDHWRPVASDNDRYCRIVAWFQVDKSGQVSNVRVTEPCDDQRQNDAALAAIRFAAPFQPLPSEYPGQFIEMQYMFYSTPTSNAPAGSAVYSDEDERDRNEQRRRDERRSFRPSLFAMPLVGFWW